MSDHDVNAILLLLLYGTASICLVALAIGVAVRHARRKP